LFYGNFLILSFIFMNYVCSFLVDSIKKNQYTVNKKAGESIS